MVINIMEIRNKIVMDIRAFFRIKELLVKLGGEGTSKTGPHWLVTQHFKSKNLLNFFLGDNVYSLTGESFKGAYAKVLKVTSNNQVYALKIEKPACHWEYYICKEIRRRLNADSVGIFVIEKLV